MSTWMDTSINISEGLNYGNATGELLSKFSVYLNGFVWQIFNSWSIILILSITNLEKMAFLSKPYPGQPKLRSGMF